MGAEFASLQQQLNDQHERWANKLCDVTTSSESSKAELQHLLDHANEKLTITKVLQPPMFVETKNTYQNYFPTIFELQQMGSFRRHWKLRGRIIAHSKNSSSA